MLYRVYFIPFRKTCGLPNISLFSIQMLILLVVFEFYLDSLVRFNITWAFSNELCPLNKRAKPSACSATKCNGSDGNLDSDELSIIREPGIFHNNEPRNPDNI